MAWMSIGATFSAANTSTQSFRMPHFDLPSQPLQSALIEYALQADVTVIVDDNIVTSLRSKTVKGPRTLDSALYTLLADAALDFVFLSDSETYVVRRKPDQPPDLEVANAPPSEYVPSFEEILVVGTQYPFRYTTVTHTQMHGAIAHFDSSRFLNTIPQTLIQDQQPTEISQVLKYASSVTPGDGVSDTNDDFYIRGFQRHALYLDGFRLGDSSGIKLMPDNVERIEILKGPSTLHYGQAEPGGVVNIIRKKPQASPFTHLSVGSGSSERVSLALDINQPLSLLSDTHYRLILGSEQQSEAEEISDITRHLLATSFRWQANTDTTVDVGYEFQQSSQVWDRSFDVLNTFGDSFTGASLSDTARQARPDFEANFNLLSGEINHILNPDWRIRLKAFLHKEYRYGIRNTGEQILNSNVLFRKEELGNDFLLLIPGGQVAIPIMIDIAEPEWLYSVGPIRSLFDENTEETAANINVNLEGSVKTGTLQHNLMAGADWHRQEIDKQYIVERRTPFAGQTWNDFGFSSALEGIATQIFSPTRPFGTFEEDRQQLNYTDIGFFLQDNIKINDRWLVSLGVRATRIEGEFIDVNEGQRTELETYKNLSSQLGVVYTYFDNHSIYANYSEALRANYHIDDIGSTIAAPELSNQYELGIKSLLWGGKAQSSLAFYQIEKRNVVELQVVEGLRTSIVGHTHRVAGMDFDITVQATAKTDLVAAISAINAEIVNGENSDKSPAMAAELTSSLFAHHQINSSFDINLGYKFVSERFGDNANAYRLPSFSTLDMGAGYEFEWGTRDAKLTLAVKNALDEEYFTAVISGIRVNQAEGREFLVNLQVGF